MSAKRKVGECRLTQSYGPLVDCHIIPKSLTKPSINGAPLVQSMPGAGFKRRWSSWYDPTIVTRDGEDILRDIDDRAIKELRHQKLVWSGWTLGPPPFSKMALCLPDHGIRILKDVDQLCIARFFLSIAWRTCVSNLQEFKSFSLDEDTEYRMRMAVLGDIEKLKSFPVSLIQLSTRGETQNLTPYLDRKEIPAIGNLPTQKVEIARIYVEGLIAHVHLNGDYDRSETDVASFLGDGTRLLVTAITYEASFQYENLITLQYEAVFGPSGAPE